MNHSPKPGRSGPNQAYYLFGAHLDVLGRLDQKALPGASNPGNFSTLVGGISFNMAVATAQLGLASTIISPLGEDAAATIVKSALAKFEIVDRTFIRSDNPTANYLSIVEPNGDLVIALADMKIYEETHSVDLSILEEAGTSENDHLVVNSNLTAKTLRSVVSHLNGLNTKRPKLVAATVSHAKAPRLRAVLNLIDCLFTNRTEAMSLLGLTDPQIKTEILVDKLHKSGCKSGTLSDGALPLYWWHGSDRGILKPRLPPDLVNVIGAGDALAGTVLAARAAGTDFELAVKYGLAAAFLLISTHESVYHGLSWPLLDELLAGRT